MKTSPLFARFFFLTLVFLSAVLAAPGYAAPANGKAVVIKVVGTASYSAAKRGRGAVQPGMIFRQGTSIVTGPASSVVFDLGNNGETMVVRPDTTLSLDMLDLVPEGSEKAAATQIDLQRGSMAFSVKKLSAASKYEVRTPNGTAGIRGSEGVIYATGVFLCLNGTMLVTVKNLSTGVTETFTATTGKTVDASGSRVQLTPITLSPAQLDAVKTDITTATLAVQQVTGTARSTAASIGSQVAAPFAVPNTSFRYNRPRRQKHRHHRRLLQSPGIPK